MSPRGRRPMRNVPGAIEKMCRRCQEIKPITEFSRAPRNRDGADCYCKPCASRRMVLSARGITQAEYDALFEKQNGICAICGGFSHRRPLHVDHDHGTQEIRGMLCNDCNAGLGFFGDDTSRLRNAALYLEGRPEVVAPRPLDDALPTVTPVAASAAEVYEQHDLFGAAT